ncbi:MAG: hypothetical protein RLZZ156_2650 [Deinococcota bacterium]|jgi:hypothetical protein
MKKLLFCLILALVACAPDMTAPTVLGRLPSETVVFALSDEISVTYNENIAPNSVNDNTVRLLAGATPMLATRTVQGNRIILRPQVAPNLPKSLEVQINGITDNAGNLAAAFAFTFDVQAWLQIGDTALTQTAKETPSLAVQGEKIAVVWLEFNANQGVNQVFVKRLNGNSWQQLGGSLNLDNAKNASRPQIAFIGNNPVVAWLEDTPTPNLIVKTWNGSAWVVLQAQGLPPSLNLLSSQSVSGLSLAVGSNNLPVVAFAEGTGGIHSVFVKQWTGSVWEQLGGIYLDIEPNKDAQKPSLALDGQNRPVVAWSEEDTIMVKRWTGSAWEQIIGSLNSTRTRELSLAVDSLGNPMVAWSESNTPTPNLDTSVFVKRREGSAWVAIGGKLNTLPAGFSPVLRTQNDTPTLLFFEDNSSDTNPANLMLSRWNGTQWITYSPLNKGRLDIPETTDMKLNSRGYPVVALVGGIDKSLVVKRWNDLP